MDFNIEFQIASIIFVTILMIVFYSKKRWPSAANVVFRIVMSLTFATLLFDIASVITITKVIAGNTELTALNNFLSKMYLVVMIAYIITMDIYAIVNTMTKSVSKVHLTISYIEAVLWILVFLISVVVIVSNPLLYGGEGKWIYSYGIPSDTVYVVSTASVVFVLIIFCLNFKKVHIKRLVPIISFAVMEGSVALIQMFNKQLLIIGLATAVSLLIMYFALENPDMNMIDELNKANKRAKDLLLNILPVSVATKLQNELQPYFEEVDNVSVMFIDIVDFTKLSSEIGGTKLVRLLNEFFGELDDVLSNFKVEKIKTIGDCYMVAAGAPDSYENNCEEIIKFGRQVLRKLSEFNKTRNCNLRVRIGVNNGRVVTGVIGKKKFIYDLWGDTVNLASRLEANGRVDRINVSERVIQILGDNYQYEELVHENLKGFGKVNSYAPV